MKRILISTLAAAGLFAMPAPALAATAYPVGDVYVRSGPGTQSEIIATLSAGQTAAVLAHEGTWLRVRTPGGAIGYMADWVTREVFDDQATYLQVTTDVLNVRTEPDALAPTLGQVQQGQQLLILEGIAGWYKVDAGAIIGTGWVKGEFTYREPIPPATAWPTPPPEPPAAEEPRQVAPKDVQAVIAASIYNGRSEEYDTIASVRAWEHLTYLDSAEGWMKVATAGGKRGWIDGADVLLTDKGVEFSRRALYSAKEGDWSMRFLKVREVVPGGTGLVLRSGPSWQAPPIRSLVQGDRMKLLAVPGGEYIQVMLTDGTTGWVSRNWVKPVPGLPEESVRLQQTGRGILRLEIAGQVGAIREGAGSLTVALPENADRQAALTVGQSGVSSMTLGPRGLTVRFDHTFRHQVIVNADGTTVLEIRPVVEQIQAVKEADREIYRLHVAGVVDPVARREGSALAIDLFGARLGEGVMLPPGMTAEADAGGVTLRVASDRAHAIKRGAGTFDLVLLAPGLAGKTVVIDPGHGGVETGAIGLSGLTEKEANLSISLKLKALMEAAGARVVITRTADTRCASPAELLKWPTADEKLRFDLSCRSTVANTVGADAFVSVHSNASPDRGVRGTETYWSGDNLNAARSRALAGLVQGELVGALGLRNLGVKENIFYVTKYTDAPAVLAEIAFLSNSAEDGLLRQDAFRQKAAEAIFRGLSRFWD
ncbi:MAG TPA: N-acetylmuramoyl-L-alanine amidase [Symbiobacteriaceae bacterium]|nr:N-acetylmuramoyl-L-alanine amidase [Symbiobacteriaceae bacterium]